jgi:hypothetical protein
MDKIRSAAAVLLSLTCAFSYAGGEEPLWNWYYAAFLAPTVGSRVLLRSGTAKVRFSRGAIHILFTEQTIPELHPEFLGEISEHSAITGILEGFFPDGSERLVGTYRESSRRTICRWHEIELRPGVADGAALFLARTDGPCQ